MAELQDCRIYWCIEILRSCDPAVLQLLSYRFVMTMSPLKVRMTSAALPSPNTACVEWPGPGRRRSVRAVVGPRVIGSSERIDPLKLFADSSKPTSVASESRIVPECELMS